jgi:hypothetical protein
MHGLEAAMLYTKHEYCVTDIKLSGPLPLFLQTLSVMVPFPARNHMNNAELERTLIKLWPEGDNRGISMTWTERKTPGTKRS